MDVWFRVETGFHRHRKAVRFRAMMGWPEDRAGEDRTIKALYRLWCETREHAPDGDLADYTPEVLAAVMGEPTDTAARLIDALLTARFLDAGKDGLLVHGWHERNGQHLREAAKKRDQRARSRGTSPPAPPHDKDKDRDKDTPPIVPLNPSGTYPGTSPGQTEMYVAPKDAEGTSLHGDAWSTRFEEFWTAWPVGHKEGRGRAEAEWSRCKPKGAVLLKAIMEGLERWKRSLRWTQDDGRFICHPATWLHQRRWLDDVREARGEEGKTWLQSEVEKAAAGEDRQG